MSDSSSNLYGLVFGVPAISTVTTSYVLTFTTPVTVMQGQANIQQNESGISLLTFSNPMQFLQVPPGPYLFSAVIATGGTSLAGSLKLSNAINADVQMASIGWENAFWYGPESTLPAGQTSLDFSWDLSDLDPLTEGQVANFLQWSIGNFPMMPE